MLTGQNANRTKCQPDIMPTKGWHFVRIFFFSWHFVRPNFLVGILSGPSQHVLAFCPNHENLPSPLGGGDFHISDRMPKYVERVRTKCQPESWDGQNANHRNKSGQNANLWLALCPVGILSGWHFVLPPRHSP